MIYCNRLCRYSEKNCKVWLNNPCRHKNKKALNLPCSKAIKGNQGHHLLPKFFSSNSLSTLYLSRQLITLLYLSCREVKPPRRKLYGWYYFRYTIFLVAENLPASAL